MIKTRTGLKPRPCFFALLLLSCPAGAQQGVEKALERARAERLWNAREWKLLLHYRRGLLGTRSEANNPGFFFSPRGRRDPQDELEAGLRALFETGGDPDSRFACRFPARTAWLAERLSLGVELFTVDCPAYRTWRGDIKADRVSLIFASSYLDNPSSMYGHTFLRMEQAEHGPGEKLLDTAVNFAAVANTRNGALFALYGLTGGFPGRYSAMPYYLKVQEYGNFESRDLWEYPLLLDARSIERLSAHIWEMGNAQFPYYFLNKNCSYQLFPLLEAARPELHLSDPWPLFVIPIDTVRALLRRGLAQTAAYRPSLASRLLERRSRLTPMEARLIRELVLKGKTMAFDALKALPRERQAPALDAAIDFLNYRIDFRREPKEADGELQRRLLLARGSLSIASPPLELRPPLAPDQGHSSSRLSLGYGAGNSAADAGRRFIELGLRPAIHDLLDPPAGYPSGSSLEMLGARLRYDPSRARAYLHDLDLIRILSLAPRDPWIQKPSWRVEAGLRTASEREPPPWRTGYFGIRGGSGLALESRLWVRALAYALLEADTGVGGIFRDSYRLGAGGTAGLLIEPLPIWRLRFHAESFAYGPFSMGDRRPVGRLRLEQAFDLSGGSALRLELGRQGRSEEASASLAVYF